MNTLITSELVKNSYISRKAARELVTILTKMVLSINHPLVTRNTKTEYLEDVVNEAFFELLKVCGKHNNNKSRFSTHVKHQINHKYLKMFVNQVISAKGRHVVYNCPKSTPLTQDQEIFKTYLVGEMLGVSKVAAPGMSSDFNGEDLTEIEYIENEIYNDSDIYTDDLNLMAMDYRLSSESCQDFAEDINQLINSKQKQIGIRKGRSKKNTTNQVKSFVDKHRETLDVLRFDYEDLFV